jgi:hypothetical protein
MANVYVIQADGRSEVMAPILCANEDRELQLVLDMNPDLLPGDQIDPENPRRWLLVKREMPVPDPSTGLDRWSIDFVFADQDAIPTFVECKRFEDTRSRREVVGQMLEYAANGHYYWSKEILRDFADHSAKAKGSSLDQLVSVLNPSSGESLDAFFEKMEQNLREGQLRIVFFLEKAPMELRSVVDFLNRQMERSEVLLVEARQYLWKGTRVVVPTLFGYTEEARQVKRSVTVTTAASRKKWDRTAFVADAQVKLAPDGAKVLESLLDQALALGYEISWGTGQATGSYSIREPTICPRSLLSVFSSGRLVFNSGWLNGSESAERGRDTLKDLLTSTVGIPVPAEYVESWPGYAFGEWGTRVQLIVDALKRLVTQFRQEAK